MPVVDQIKSSAALPDLPPIDDGSVMDKVISVARYTGIPQIVGMSFKKLAEVDQATRQGILTLRGAVPREKFPQYFKSALDGQLNMSNTEFMRAFLGSQLHAQLDKVPLIPGWTKTVLNPDTKLAEVVPKLSVGSALDWSVDLWATPWAVLSFTPVEWAKNLPFIAKLPIWSPFKAMSRGINTIDNAIFGTASRFSLVGPLLMHVREVTRALERHPEVGRDFLNTRDAHYKAISGIAPVLHDIFFNSEKTWGITRSIRKYAPDAEKRVMKYLFGLPGVQSPAALSIEEHGLANEIMDKIGEPLIRRLQDMGYYRKDWTRADRLADIFPSLVNLKSLPADVLQSWDWRTLGMLGVPTYFTPAEAKKLGAGIGAATAAKRAAKLGKLGISDENLDLHSAIKDLVLAGEKKLWWNARHKVTEPVTRTIATGLTDQFGNKITSTVQGTRTHWVNDGPLLKYRPRKTNVPGLQNRNVASWTSYERSYMVRLINEYQGKARGRFALELGEQARRFADGLQDWAGASRVKKLILNTAAPWLSVGGGLKTNVYSKPQFATQFFVHNTVRSVLWGNLGAAIKNTSQLINTATVKGLPATLKGMFHLSNPEYRELAGKEVWHEFKRLMTDETFGARIGTSLDNIMMKPFNITENFARGTAFNVYLDDYMKRSRVGSIAALRANPANFEAAIRHAVHGSLETNFIYGILGRPASVLGSPMLRPLTTLLSYGPKQAEFLRRSFLNDGSSVIRAIGMNGWAIDMANRYAGIAPESWLGWGFLPPTKSVEGMPLVTSPQIQFALNLTQAMGHAGEGRPQDAAKSLRAAQGSMGQMLDLAADFWHRHADGTKDPDLQGWTGPGAELVKTVLGGAQALGWMPFPAVAVARDLRVARMLGLGVESSSSGETWVPITKADALKSFAFQTTIQKSRADLAGMEARAKGKIDKALDERVRHYLAAANGTNGDELMDAARELAAPIRISHGLLKEPPSTYLPDPDQIDRRIKNILANKTQGRDIKNMHDSGFLMDIYWSQYIDLVMKDLEASH